MSRYGLDLTYEQKFGMSRACFRGSCANSLNKEKCKGNKVRRTGQPCSCDCHE